MLYKFRFSSCLNKFKQHKFYIEDENIGNYRWSVKNPKRYEYYYWTGYFSHNSRLVK